MLKIFFSILLFYICFDLFKLNNQAIAEEIREINQIYQMKIDQTINPATLSHLSALLSNARAEKNSAIVIQINTPGGLVSVTKKMITEIGESGLPYIAVVGPQGASATSAGAILSAAAHHLLMYPGTNIGAATPISIQSEIPKDSRDKAINDLVALVTSLREAKNKPTKEFKEMITTAKSFSAKEAINLEIADNFITSPNELIQLIDGKTFILNEKSIKIKISTNVQMHSIEMDLGQKILNFLASPELAYLLFLFGAALIYFELQAPGGFIAGSIGAVLLIIAGISFQVIPLNIGGFGLIVLAFVLFVLEMYITSFGLLSLAGITSMVFGSLFLFRTDDAYFELSKTLIAATTSAVVCFLSIIVFIFVKTRKRMNSNFNDQLPANGVILKIVENKDGNYIYQIKVHGEIWKATSEKVFSVGETVDIKSKNTDNMTYIL